MSKSDRMTIIVLEPSIAAKALEVAKQLAAKTGRKVTVRTSDGVEVDAMFSTKH